MLVHFLPFPPLLCCFGSSSFPSRIATGSPSIPAARSRSPTCFNFNGRPRRQVAVGPDERRRVNVARSIKARTKYIYRLIRLALITPHLNERKGNFRESAFTAVEQGLGKQAIRTDHHHDQPSVVLVERRVDARCIQKIRRNPFQMQKSWRSLGICKNTRTQ